MLGSDGVSLSPCRLQNSYTASQRANQDLEEKLHALVTFWLLTLTSNVCVCVISLGENKWRSKVSDFCCEIQQLPGSEFELMLHTDGQINNQISDQINTNRKRTRLVRPDNQINVTRLM